MRSSATNARFVLISWTESGHTYTTISIRDRANVWWVSSYDRETAVLFAADAALSAKWVDDRTVLIQAAVGPGGFVSQYAYRAGEVLVRIEINSVDSRPVRDFILNSRAEISTEKIARFPCNFGCEA